MSLNSRKKSWYDRLKHLLAFHSSVGLASNIGGGTTGLGEEAGEEWLENRTEDNLSAVRHWESHPQDQDELEDVVEC